MIPLFRGFLLLLLVFFIVGVAAAGELYQQPFGDPRPCDKGQEKINAAQCCKYYYLCEGGLCKRKKKKSK